MGCKVVVVVNRIIAFYFIYITRSCVYDKRKRKILFSTKLLMHNILFLWEVYFVLREVLEKKLIITVIAVCFIDTQINVKRYLILILYLQDLAPNIGYIDIDLFFILSTLVYILLVHRRDRMSTKHETTFTSFA